MAAIALHNFQTSCMTIHRLRTDANVSLFSSGENVLLYLQTIHDIDTVLALFMKSSILILDWKLTFRYVPVGACLKHEMAKWRNDEIAKWRNGTKDKSHSYKILPFL